MFATPVALDGKTARVAVALEVRAPYTVVGQSDGSVGDSLRATVLAVDLKKKKVTRRVNRRADIVISAPRVSSAGEVSYHLVMAVDVPTGAYQLRASVASDRVGKAGSVYLTLDVPEPPKSGVAVVGLAVGLAGRGSYPISPTTDGPLPIRPVFDRIFSPADTLRIVYWVARKEPTTAVLSRVDIVNGQDQVMLSVEGRKELGVDGLAKSDIPLSTLAPGSYRLKVTTVGGGRSAEREVGFVVQ